MVAPSKYGNEFDPTFYSGYDYFSMLGFQLIHVSNRAASVVVIYSIPNDMHIKPSLRFICVHCIRRIWVTTHNGVLVTI